MADVVPIGCITRLDIPAERVLRAALERGNGTPGAALKDAVVLGFDEDGDFYFASSKADGGAVLWLMALAQKRLLDFGDA